MIAATQRLDVVAGLESWVVGKFFDDGYHRLAVEDTRDVVGNG